MYNNEKKKTHNHLASIFDLPRRNGNMIGTRLVFSIFHHHLSPHPFLPFPPTPLWDCKVVIYN